MVDIVWMVLLGAVIGGIVVLALGPEPDGSAESTREVTGDGSVTSTGLTSSAPARDRGAVMSPSWSALDDLQYHRFLDRSSPPP